VEMRRRSAGQVRRIALAELVQVRAAVVKASERFRERRLGRIELAAGQPRNLRNEVRLAARPRNFHVCKYNALQGDDPSANSNSTGGFQL
ncbi:MAG: hypothetical protein WCA17_00105, partial [Burkholderiales bacterium]